MSHEITRQDTPVYVGRPAWHKIGTTRTVEWAREHSHFDLAVEANIDFPVEKITVTGTYVGPNGDVHVIEFDDYAGIVRTDTLGPLSIQGSGYTIAPNRELSDILDGINEAAHDGRIIDPEAGVSLKGGRVVILTGKFREQITLPGGDVIEPYLFAVNSHDGSVATKIRSCFHRIECNNMLQAGLAGSAKIDLTVRHTSGRGDRMDEGRKALAFALNDLRNFQAEAESMIAAEVTDAQFRTIVSDIVKPSQNTDSARIKADADRTAIVGLWSDDGRVGNYKGTAWGAFQAVSTWEQHLVPGRDVDTRNVLAASTASFKLSEAMLKRLRPLLAPVG